MRHTCHLILLSFLIGFSAFTHQLHAEEPAKSPEAIQKDFQMTLAKSIAKLRATERSRKYQLKYMNDSIRFTLEAADLLMQQRSYQHAESLIQQALAAYPENIIARLILADIFETQNKQEEANRSYEQFLKDGEKESQLTNDVTDFETRKVFAEYVRRKLASQQIFPPKPKGYTFLPLALRLQTGEKSLLLGFVAAGIPVLMIVMTVIFIARKISNLYEPRISYFDKMVFGTFTTLLLTYALWALHLFLNLPPIIKPVEYEILIVLCLGLAWVVVNLIREKRQKEDRYKNDPTLKKCPHCKRYTEKLMVICPNCNREIQD